MTTSNANNTDASYYEYWIGKDTNYEQLWNDYERGADVYRDKFKSMKVFLIKFKFKYPNKKLPLFNLEVIIKTIKGLYHDFKDPRNNFLSESEYNNEGPIFVYSIERNSFDPNFLIVGGKAVIFLMFVCKQYLDIKGQLLKNKGEKLKNEGLELDNLMKKFDLIKKVSDYDDVIKKLKENELSSRVKFALEKLFDDNQGLEKIELSNKKFNGNVHDSEKKTIQINFTKTEIKIKEKERSKKKKAAKKEKVRKTKKKKKVIKKAVAAKPKKRRKARKNKYKMMG